MNLEKILETLPNTKNDVVVVLSGGLDSSITARLAVEKYGANRVHALSYFYGQKQSVEVDKAVDVVGHLGLKSHQLVNISFLGDMVRGVSANISGTSLAMPSIKDVLGDPTPPSYVPNRNAILLMIAASYAEANNADVVFTGLQAQDAYGYWDTTPQFVSNMNNVLSSNRKNPVQICAPFQGLNKATELEILFEMDGNVDLTTKTITCYDPDGGISCARCPSCAERIQNFAVAGFVDNIRYATSIDWNSIIKERKK